MDEISRIIDQLKVAKTIARNEGQAMLVYLIDLAIQEAMDVQAKRLGRTASWIVTLLGSAASLAAQTSGMT